jgi:hypothetical protein
MNFGPLGTRTRDLPPGRYHILVREKLIKERIEYIEQMIHSKLIIVSSHAGIQWKIHYLIQTDQVRFVFHSYFFLRCFNCAGVES